MINFIRKIRRQLLSENKFTKYITYAFGEIVLVVFGILIALQINNQNESNKLLQKELQYLNNIKSDLVNSVSRIEDFMASRQKAISSSKAIVDHFEGKPIENWHEFNEQCVDIYSWQRFYQVNYTFEELVYSGNLALIANDSIKELLLRLESLYKQLKAEEDHFRYDSEVLIYEPVYNAIDHQLILKEHFGVDANLSYEIFSDFFSDLRIKNGFVMAGLEFSIMNGQLAQMKKLSEQLIGLIENEIKTRG